MTIDQALAIIILILSILGLINAGIGIRWLRKAQEAFRCDDYETFREYIKKSHTIDTICLIKMIVTFVLILVMAFLKLGR